MPTNPFACSECRLIIPDEKKSGPYSSKKKSDLKKECEKRELSQVGKVEDLVNRLRQSDLEQKELSVLVAELKELSPNIENIPSEKEELISKLMKEMNKKYQPLCHIHPSAPVSSDWNGYVVVIDPSRSEIAKRLNIKVPGKYALKVNINR